MGNSQQVKEDLCPVGEIRRTDDKFFKREAPVEGSGTTSHVAAAGEGSPRGGAQDWEELGVLELQKQRARNRKSLSQGRKVAFQVPKRQARRPPGFDHEATFPDESALQALGANGSLQNLLVSIRDNRWEDVQKTLVDAPEAAAQVDQHGQSLIFFAAGAGHLEVVRSLLDYDAEVNASNKMGYTPLMRACRHGRTKVAEEFFRHGADLSAVDAYKATVLQVAALCDTTDAVEWLLQKEQAQALIKQKDCDGVTPLLAAVKVGNCEVARLLLEARACPLTTDISGRPPLLHALARSELDLVQVLIGHGADVNAEDGEGRSFLLNLIDNVLKAGRQTESKMIALTGLTAALEAKADLDAQDTAGITPLMMAAKSGEVMTCALLAAYNADVFTEDDQERSALSIATKKNFSDVCKVLKDFGAVRTFKNEKLNRKLLRAAFYGASAATSTMLDRGGDPLARSRGGKSAMDVAQKAGSLQCFHLLSSAEREGRAGQAQGAVAAVDRDKALKRWLSEVQQVGDWFTRMQRGVRNCDADVVVFVTSQVNKPQSTIQTDTTAAVVLAEYVTSRRRALALKGLNDLRVLRARMRHGRLIDFAKALDAWDASAVHGQCLHALQRLVGAAVSAVRSVQLSPTEAADEHCAALDCFQCEVLREPLSFVSELVSVFAEVDNAYKTIPDDHGEHVVKPFMCSKCYSRFTLEAALTEHMLHCKVKAQDPKYERERRCAAKVESALQLLVSVGKSLAKRTKNCEELLAKVRVAEKQAPKRGQEYLKAIPAVRGTLRMLEAVHHLYLHRSCIIERDAGEVARAWSLRDPYRAAELDTVAKEHQFCLACFVQEVTRACLHEDGTKHRCICSACTLQLSGKVKAGEQVPCPACQQPIKAFIVARHVSKERRRA